MRASTTVDVKAAVQNALLFLKEVMPDSRPNSALLEEIELSDDGKTWFITVSVPSTRTFASLMGTALEDRDYKTIQIDSSTGELISIKIRKV